MERGVCYVANTSGYIDEALISLASLRRTAPELPVCFIAPQAMWRGNIEGVMWRDHTFDRKGPIVKIAAYASPFEQTLFLDTDTFVTSDIDEIFDILDQYDIAAAHEATRGWDYPCVAPKVFCEFNTGVVVFKKSDAVAGFFKVWGDIYDEMFAQYGINNDQASFREAAWRTSARIAALPSEYNVFFVFGAYIAWEAKILHGRGDLAVFAREINAHIGPRVYNFALGLFPSFRGYRKLAADVIRAIINAGAVILGRRKLNGPGAPVAWHHEKKAFVGSASKDG